MADLSSIKLFATRPHPCSYIDSEEATTIFVDPATTIDAGIYSHLSELGFRRSGSHIYRPQCATCNACIPIRVPTETFKATRSQSRCFKKNRDLHIEQVSSIDCDEYFDLYKRYIEARHSDGDMYPPTRSQFTDFLTTEWQVTRYVIMRTPEGKLLSVAMADVIESGISAIYTFFDPEEDKRSLGVYNVLSQIQWATELNLPYVYLGYWIKQSLKMNYKVNFQPFQVFVNNHWVTISCNKQAKNNPATSPSTPPE
ncbi:MAG: arginyltransferase [Alteromonadaceae bacterium]|nr:MAG: arginyltransferase [Alteromonadaceae bacterium]